MSDCCQPLWISTLDPKEIFLKVVTSSNKGKCWQDMFLPLPVTKNKVVKKERRKFMGLFKRKPKLVKVSCEVDGRLPVMGLPTIGILKGWLDQKIMELNTEERFVVSTVERGVLHVEWTEDPSEWSAKEILELPEDLLVGNSLRAQNTILDEGQLIKAPVSERRLTSVYTHVPFVEVIRVGLTSMLEVVSSYKERHRDWKARLTGLRNNRWWGYYFLREKWAAYR